MKTWEWAIQRVARIEDEERVERLAQMFFDSLDKEFLSSETMDQDEYDSIVKRFRQAEGN